MFTGIIETVGTVTGCEPLGEVLRLRIDAPAILDGIRNGDSIAVNGACLTVTQIEGSTLTFDAVRETIDRTALSKLAAGSRVNLERAMRADGRLDGHIVQGHVDATGTVRALDR